MTGLLLVQTALSMVLLAGAGMFGQSLYKLAAQDFGMRMAGVAVVEFEQGPNVGNRNQVLGDVLEQVRALPGVETATVIDTVPFTGFNVPPISVPGLHGAAESRRAAAVSHRLHALSSSKILDVQDRRGPRIHGGGRPRSARRHRQSNDGAAGVAG